MKTLTLTIVLAACATVTAIAQSKKSVVIGTMIDRPNAVLVINPPNKDQGFLLPQLTSSERKAIAPSSPQDDGLIVFDVTDKSFYYWNSGAWIKGLGDSTTGLLAYDPSTQSLSLNGGGTVSLSTLKEVPSMTGQAGKYLTTDGTTLTWASLGSLGDITSIIAGQGLTGGATAGDVNLSVNTDGTTISVNGSNQLQLSNNAVTTSKLAAGSVNSSHIIDGAVTSTDILDNTITTNDIANATITGANIANATITTTNISGGGNNKVLATDGAGVVTWTDRSTFVDDNQNLSLSGSTLNIDNGTGVNLIASGQITGPLDNLNIAPGIGNQVMTTNGAGTAAVWSAPAGDVTGPVSGSTVTRIQGRDVSNTAPMLNEALIWNGTAWAPGNAAVAVAPTIQYYAVDPANFQPVEPGAGTTTLGLFQSGGGSYVFAKGSSRQIMAPINLPDGATIQNITIYYEFTLLVGPITATFIRKPYGGLNNALSSVTSILALGMGNASMAPPPPTNLVDNNSYTYRLIVTFTNLLDTNDANAIQRVHGIKIQYSK